ncbi:PaaI family thioesterase [Streptomyces sp. ME02-6991-2A]|uniref:PaaI family thioesterase n=1 Tax=Streptomyces sp. ME02-6991-2A TaxID=3028677 RepID=UPI0029AA8006|nr:PaaI family thioesterase [Streptomyces sp. ME02-6991-2A]MDX3374710.1 PaaI family thioesterase [Streptomyces sp. ME02-6991-2A]
MNPHPTAPSTTPRTPRSRDLARQREAITALGHELRMLLDATVRTAASPKTLEDMAAGVRSLTGQLTGHRRSVSEIPEVDEFPGGLRMYSPATGPGSPIAPPMRVTPTQDGVTGHLRLGIAHEGPPGYGHGGISAMLLDELMGWACAATGTPGMTISLHMRYQGPVPLETPLIARAHVAGTDNRKIFVKGSIAIEASASTTLVEADGVFVAPDAEAARSLFPTLKNAR